MMNLNPLFKDKTIFKCISIAGLYESLAEEAAELAQASLKAARVLRNENPTNLNYSQALKNIIEEYSDVVNIATILNVKPNNDIQYTKMTRMLERLNEKLNKQGGTP